MVYLRTFATFLLLLSLASCATPGTSKESKKTGDRLTMGLALEPGTVRDFQYTTTVASTSRYQNQSILAQGQTDIHLRGTVTRIDRNRITYIDMEIVAYSATDGVQVNGGARLADEQVDLYLAGLARALPGKKFTAAVDPQGKVIGVEWRTDVAKAVKDELDRGVINIFSQVPGESLAWQIRFANYLAPENIISVLDAFFRTLPNRPVREGDQWLMGPDNIWWGQMWLQGMLTLESHGKGSASAKLEAMVSSPRENAGPTRITGPVTGTARYDTSTGLATFQERHFEITAPAELPFPPGLMLLEKITKHETLRITGG